MQLHSRPPVLFAVDAVNGLFRETEYRDTESRRLRPNQLSVLKPILGLFTRKTRPPKSAVIGSMDSTETGTLSPFLEQKMNLRDAPLNRVADLAVILPEKAAPAHLSGLSASKTYRSMGAPTPWPVFPYDREEVEAAVKLYSESSLLRDTLEPQDVRIGKFLALSGGNPLKVFKLAALQRSPGRPAPRTGHGTKATL